ncbi:MAG: DUF2279 domain-containing protein [Bacteroidia bacterium]
MVKKFILILFIFPISFSAYSQNEIDSIHTHKHRFNLSITTQTVFTAATIIVLNEAWYKEHHSSQFRFFNDNAEWLQMDKIGHLFSAYHLTNYCNALYKWCGLTNKKANLISGLYSFSYLLGIEILDGFSEKWGFSWGDIFANASGTALAITQHQLGAEIFFTLKFSFSESGYAPLRPNLLGKTYAEQILKDYNGQTYWLSLNPSSIFKIEKAYFPNWLNLALGYSGEGMIAARNNQLVEIQKNNATYYLKANHKRQFLISIDIDLKKIPVKNKYLKNIFSVINILKIPAPALEFNKYGSKFHFLYF